MNAPSDSDRPVNPYRLGTSIVVGTVLGSFALCLAGTLAGRAREGAEAAPAAASASTPAGQDLGANAFPLGSFRLVERSGATVDDSTLSGRVCVVSFIFTHCPLSCPKITSVMKSLQPRLEGTGALLVSISVDPERDTPEVLSEYAKRFGADPNRWLFLTGPKDEVHRLIQDRFKLGVRAATADEVKAGTEEFLHSEKLALVDRGKIVGFYDSNEREAVESLVAKVSALAHEPPAWARRLPAVNASLNGVCAVLLLAGWSLIRKGNARGHAAAMIACVATSALFLACYLVYHYQVGSVPFRGQGPVRLVYLTILLSHTLLATFGVVPLVALTLNHAVRRRFDRHARIARVTFPIWLYVSVTGVVIYLMLYQLPSSPGLV